MNSRQLIILPFRGTCASALGALIGGTLPAAALMLFTFCSWFVAGASEFDRQVDLRRLREDLVWPVIGCAVVCACAAWTTFAPVGKYRFARTLAIIVAVCVPMWFVLNAMALTPRRLKGVGHPAIYPSELIELIGPPVLIAVILTVVRISGPRRHAMPGSDRPSPGHRESGA